jgi:hypothetical protein
VRSLAFAVGALAVLGSDAAAEPLFDGRPHVAMEPVHEHPPAGFGGSAVFGWSGDDGWVARLDYELLPVMAPHGTFGPVLGSMGGLEYWRHDDDQGFSIPALWVGGVKLFPMRVLLGVGIEALTVDKVNSDWGVGTCGPIAMASVSLDVVGIRVGVEARATRHVNIGADDFNQLQLAISVGYTWSTVKRGRAPYY